MLTNSIILDLLLLLSLAIGLAFLSLQVLEKYNNYQEKKEENKDNQSCEEKKDAVLDKIEEDFRWFSPEYYSFRTLLITFLVALGLALGYTLSGIPSITALILSFLAFIGLLVFLRMAHTRYTQAQNPAKEKLDTFEEQLDKSLNKAIEFQGDKIQSFSKADEEFDTETKSFTFVVKKVKKSFPKFWNSKAPSFIIEQKKEFLVLSSDYFNIFKNASTFDLLNPKFNKDCELAPANVGEGIEHYYSQMKSVEYNKDEGAIVIYYYNDEPVKFICKKDAKAIKALQEKLRLTERQRLRKIDEHENYEKIRDRRDNLGVHNKELDVIITQETKDKNDESNDKT